MARSLPHRASHGRPRRFIGSVIALALLAGLVYRQLLFWDPSKPGLPDAEWLFFSIGDTAPQLVFAIAAFLLYRRRRRLAAALGGEGSPVAALPLLGTGFALFLWAHHVDAPDLLLVSLILFSLGSALLLSGAGLARAIALPLLFLAFAIPIPGVLTNQIVFPLQLWNAELSAQLLNFAGIPVVQEGDMLSFADRNLEIIETCSGFRSILMLAMLAVGLVCYFPAGRMHLTLLVASALVIACLVNLARILAMALFPESEESETHALQGAVLFLLGSAAVCVVDMVLRRREGGGATPASVADPEAATPLRRQPGKIEHLMALAVLLGLMLGASIWLPRWTPPASPEFARIPLPRKIGDWEWIESLKPGWRYLGSVRFRKSLYRRYQRGDETVSIFVGYDDRLDRSRSLLSPKNALPGAGWQVEERASIQLTPGGLRAESVSARSGPSRILSHHWYEGTDRLVLEILRAWLATDQSPLRRPGGAWTVRLSTDAAPTREEKEAAEARLRGFAELLGPRIPPPEEAT
jgi:EpsI family protein